MHTCCCHVSLQQICARWKTDEDFTRIILINFPGQFNSGGRTCGHVKLSNNDRLTERSIFSSISDGFSSDEYHFHFCNISAMDFRKSPSEDVCVFPRYDKKKMFQQCKEAQGVLLIWQGFKRNLLNKLNIACMNWTRSKTLVQYSRNYNCRIGAEHRLPGNIRGKWKNFHFTRNKVGRGKIFNTGMT